MRIPCDSDELGGVLAYPLAPQPTAAALIVGPHPMMGGRATNNVVRHVGRGLAEQAFLTLRFEFAAGGPTPEIMERFWRTGHAPDDSRRGAEAVAACEWLVAIRALPLVLVGYSFGASLLAELVDRPQVRAVVMIGATLEQHDYGPLARCGVPKLVLAADNDFATPLAATEHWLQQAADPKRMVVLSGGEHFYRGQEQRIVEEIAAWTGTSI